ncbi:Putative large secreted protein SCO0341 [hydrothermal vent metagenome]|uniref:Large secreted protein SCO0341 n=1 Tax=hydrothermal vent metagenome TaxID=652676 RepID=A0A3B1C6E4_9ZZZZ
MSPIKKFLVLSLAILTVSGCTNSAKNENINSELKLWYKQPAEKWTEALPIGNGRLGAMVFGGVKKERIQLNEESLWAGVPVNNNNPGASKHLKEIQQLLLAEQTVKARKLGDQYLLGTPPRIRAYQTLGDLKLVFSNEDDSVSNYRRELDLSTGISKVSYKIGETTFTREVFASAVDNVIVIHISSNKSSRINLTVSLDRIIDAATKAVSNNTLLMTGQIIDKDQPERGPLGKHMKFSTELKMHNNGGTLQKNGDQLAVRNADEVTIILTAATDYNINKLNFDRTIEPSKVCNDIIAKASSKSYDDLKESHIKEHSAIFNRVVFNLGKDPNNNLPTDERLEKVKNGEEDLGLITLYFQYGRYLLMSSSRYPGVLPANLQGIWNEHIDPPWGSDYHTNINLQMNYWPAEVCNLSETVLPLTKYFTGLLIPGKVTAKEMYNARGWTMHHVSDPFGRTGLMDGIGWGTSPLAGAWMSLTFWRHYQFTQDKNYLREKAYPIMKGSAQFILDFLIDDGKGRLVTAPSISPENMYINPRFGKNARITYAATIDIQIIHELFNACIQAEKILNIDPELVSQMRKTLTKLPPVLIGKDGTIREWIEDYEEAEPGHRHMSHLFGLHPGTQITPDTPKLFEAAKKTIEKRLANGGGHTGWSRAWIVNFYARLFDGENAYKHLLALLRKSTLPNLFDSHPPFQIDGNFGGTAGIAEMLLQSHNNIIHVLPAIPSKWQDGFVKGLKARGNFTVDIYWNRGELTKLVIKSGSGDDCNIRYKNKTIQLKTEIGKEYIFNNKLKGGFE